MKNKLTDLNNHIFAQIERLNDEKLRGKKLNQEINRARALATLAAQEIALGRLVLDANVAATEYRLKFKPNELLSSPSGE